MISLSKTRKENLSVLMVCGTLYPSQTGGVDNAVYWHAKALYNYGVKVFTITSSYGIKESELVLDRWLVTDYGSVIYLKLKNNRKPFFWILRVLKKILFIRRPDVIHFHSLIYSFPFLVIIPFLKSKIVWSVHGELDPSARIIGNTILKKIIFFSYRLFSSRIYFHSTCKSESDYIKNEFGLNTKVIQFGIGMELPNQFLINSKKKYFSYIGRIDSKKGIDNLIKALSMSKLFLSSDFVLNIAGECNHDYGSLLKTLVADLNLSLKIKFVGHLSGLKKQKFLAESYFNFMPSHTENFGIVTLEALAQGTPCLASKGTPWELLEEYNIGYWVDNSPVALKDAINSILSLSNEQYYDMSINTRKVVEKIFDYNIVYKPWVPFYRNLIS